MGWGGADGGIKTRDSSGGLSSGGREAGFSAGVRTRGQKKSSALVIRQYQAFRRY